MERVGGYWGLAIITSTEYTAVSFKRDIVDGVIEGRVLIWFLRDPLQGESLPDQ